MTPADSVQAAHGLESDSNTDGVSDSPIRTGDPPRTRPVTAMARLEVVRKSLLRSWPFVVVLLGFLVYVVSWSLISIARFDSHHALVYDLGDTMEQMWLVVHSHASFVAAFATFLFEGLPFVLFPVALLGGYPAMLVLQSVAIGGTALPIYGIARRLLRDRTSSMLLALSSLAFFVSSGANWYDFHFEVFFPILFLTAYYFLLRGDRRLAFGLFLAVSFVRFPFGVFPLLFGLLLVFESSVLHQSADGMSRKETLRFGSALALASAGLLAATFLFALPIVLGGGQFGALLQFSQTTSSAGPVVGGYDQLLTLILPLAALLFLPLFSRRWIPLFVPYVFLLYATGFWAYSYPYAFGFQYAYSLVPFLYLAAIDALSRGWIRPPPSPVRTRLRLPRWLRGRNYTMRTTVTGVFLVVLLMALFFEPYGPLNSLTESPFHFEENLSGNSTLLHEYERLTTLIPRSDPNVLIQDNMPELFPRPLAANEPLIPGVSLFSPFTDADAANGSFPVWQYGKIVSVRFDYALADLGSPQYLYGTPNMQDFVRAMYDTGAYGIFGEAGGMILLKYHYTGPIAYYQPYAASFGARDLVDWPGLQPVSGNVISSTNVSGNIALWNGPYAPLMPGLYKVTFALRTTNASPQNWALLQVLEGPNASLLAESTVSGGDFPVAGHPEHLGLEFYASGPESYLQFIARSLQWNGTLSLSGISIQQVGPPTPTFRVGISPRADLFYQLLGTIPPGSTVLVQPGYQGGILNLTVETPESLAGSPDYMLVDPYSPGFPCPVPCSENHSAQALVNGGLENGTYGILDEVQGMILTERGYRGPVLSYVPYQATFFPGQLFSWPSELPLVNQTLSWSNVSGNWPALWNGPFSALAPGSYAVSFELRTSLTAAANRAEFQVLAGPTAKLLLNQTAFNGSAFTQSASWTNLTVVFSAPLTYDSVQYIVRALSWSGTLSLSSVSVVQQSPG